MSTRLDDETALRAVIDDLANQLCLTVDGKFDLTVSAKADDETVEKLAMLVNFVLDNARRALSELERRNESLAELDRLKSDLVANVSHELRTPLALIVGPAETMLANADNLTEVQRRDLDVIRRNATTLLKHVNDLLDLSKLESGKMELNYAELDLAALLRTVAGCFEALAPQREITCLVDAPAQLIGDADAEKIERILLNLLSNAFKFVPPRGRVQVSMQSPQPDTVRIVVDDTGPGVRPALREKILERFRQGDESATRQFGGTGLGLPIARDFVELHGGRITVDDAPGGGARFSVELPLHAPPGVRVAPRTQPEPPRLDPSLKGALEELKPIVIERSLRLSGSGDASRPSVLVVEDNPEMNRFIAESLACSFDVITATNGREGLEQVLAQQPDLVVTDIMMPSMSGDQLVHAIRQRRELDSLPILVLSAKADHALRVQLLREGVQDYIIKPFSADELRARASNWATAKRARDLLQLELDSRQHSLEELAREVTRKKRELEAALYQVNLAREEAVHASEVKSGFLSMASHEFRTPLTTLRMQLDRLERGKSGALGDKQKEMVRKAFNSSRRLEELVESLLEYTRLESGRLRPRPEAFEPAVLCAEALDELRPRAETKSLALRLAAPPDCQFCCDPRLLRLVVLNLVDNAVKFTEAGSIDVRVAVEADKLQLCVEDTGPGIPAAEQLRVFEPFEQLERVSRKHKPGVGLGLAIVKKVTEALAGRVELKSEPGKGTLFTVSIPAMDKSEEVTLN